MHRRQGCCHVYAWSFPSEHDLAVKSETVSKRRQAEDYVTTAVKIGFDQHTHCSYLQKENGLF